MSSKRAQYTEQLMQDSATATGNGTALDMDGFNIAMLQVSGISGDTITIEATIDESTWDAWGAKNSADTLATTITADGLYRVDAFAVSQVRARVSTYSAGTIIVLGRATA